VTRHQNERQSGRRARWPGSLRKVAPGLCRAGGLGACRGSRSGAGQLARRALPAGRPGDRPTGIALAAVAARC